MHFPSLFPLPLASTVLLSLTSLLRRRRPLSPSPFSCPRLPEPFRTHPRLLRNAAIAYRGGDAHSATFASPHSIARTLGTPTMCVCIGLPVPVDVSPYLRSITKDEEKQFDLEKLLHPPQMKENKNSEKDAQEGTNNQKTENAGEIESESEEFADEHGGSVSVRVQYPRPFQNPLFTAELSGVSPYFFFSPDLSRAFQKLPAQFHASERARIRAKHEDARRQKEEQERLLRQEEEERWQRLEEERRQRKKEEEEAKKRS